MSDLNAVFGALGDETRRAILARLLAGETRLSDLAAPFDMSQTAVSKHVRVLSDAGLVAVEKKGRVRYCRLTATPMRDAADWLTDYAAFWGANFEQLGRHLAKDEG